VGTVVFCAVLVGVATWLLAGRTSVLRPDGRFPEREPQQRRAVQGVREHLFGEYDESYDLHAAQRRALESYGWVDQKAGTVHIPIERAYDLLLAEEARQK
jgi:hypothetical protein